MGRLVGAGGTVAILTLVGLFLGLGAYFLEDVSRPGDALSTSDVSFVHAPDIIDPVCFWPILDAAFSADGTSAPSRIPLQGCAPEGAEIEVVGDWTRVLLLFRPDGAPEFRRRSSGIRVSLATPDGAMMLDAYDSGGGAGAFPSRITGHLASDGTALTHIRTYAFGDRCRIGRVGTSVQQDGRFIANASMTPWDIMMAPLSHLPYDVQWETGKVQWGKAFRPASSCATCCSAVTREYVTDGQNGFALVGLRYDPGAAPSSEDALTVCLEEAVRQAAGADGLVEAGEQAALGPLIDACAQEMSN